MHDSWTDGGEEQGCSGDCFSRALDIFVVSMLEIEIVELYDKSPAACWASRKKKNGAKSSS